MRVLICGDRNWSNHSTIRTKLEQLPPSTIVIHGACRGADRIAGEIAKGLSLEVVEFPANWRRYGRGAGPIRNQQMLDEGKPDVVWAFHPDLNHSKGTKDMIQKATAAGVRIRVFGAPFT